MTRILAAALWLVIFSGLGAIAAAIAADDGAAILDQYLAAAQQSNESLRGQTMAVEIHGSIPRLSREGGMKATRSISNSGEITYGPMTFDGHDSIKREVIARFLQAEVEASKRPSLGITPANYKFKYWGLYGSGDWQLYLFELTPRRKVPGLFEGWLWVEAKSGLPVREQGRFVKNPSVFLKRVEFVRDYDVSSGQARPSKLESIVTVRVVGEAKLTVEYQDYHSTVTAQKR